MPYDLFISYSRRDNQDGRVSRLVETIAANFRAFAGRPLHPWVDVDQLRLMHDWQSQLQQKLRESTLLLAVISPNYLNSRFCEFEFNEYLKLEGARGLRDGGVVPIYLVETPGWNDGDFDQRAADWIKELRRRQHIDLHQWPGEGTADQAEIDAGIAELAKRIKPLLRQGEVVARDLGNVDRHNPHFVGRSEDLRRLHSTLLAGQTGVLAAIHGLGGMGKTALAVEYAHVYAGEYGGGRWQVRCEGRDDLRLALASLAPTLHVSFSEAELGDLNLQLARILAELRALADAHEPQRCLLILDNVDQPALLEPAQTTHLPSSSWLHLIVTTQLGKSDLPWRQGDLAFLPVDELPEAEAIKLIESYQPLEQFRNNEEREAAKEIVRLLGGLALAVETAAVFLGRFEDVTCQAFLERLRRERFAGLEAIAGHQDVKVKHGEKRVSATLQPMLERLSDVERRALQVAALLPADYIAVPWIKTLVAADFPELGKDVEPGYPDAWQDAVRRLVSLRLWQPTKVVDQLGLLLMARMHRLVQDVLTRDSAAAEADFAKLILHAKGRCLFLRENWLDWGTRWEIEPMKALSETLLALEHNEASWLANSIGQRLFNLARYAEAEPLMRRALVIDEQSYGADHPNVANRLNNLAQLLQATNRLGEAEPLMRRALVIDEQSYGADYPSVARDLNNLAQLLKATNRLGEAEPLMRRALMIDEQSYGAEHPNVAIRLNNLAQLLQDTNRLEESEPMMRRALEIDEQSYGAVHPKVAIRLNNLAQLLQATNRLAEAEPLMRRSLEIRLQFKVATGHEHPGFRTVINNYKGLLQDMGRSEQEIQAQLNEVGRPFGMQLGD